MDNSPWEEIYDNIQVLARVNSWEDAVTRAAEPLLKKEMIEKRYVDAMISNIEKLGAYMIIAPQVIMPHARPEDGVLRTGISLLKLEEGVDFKADEDPIKLLFVLASEDSNKHIEILMKLMEIIEDEELVNKVIKSKSVEEIIELL